MDEVQYIVDHSDAKFYFAEGQEEVDKALSIRENCPKLKKIIWDDPKGMRHYDDPMLISLKEVMRLDGIGARESEDPEPDLFERPDRSREPASDVCLLFYTSGTTGVAQRSSPHPLQYAQNGPEPDDGGPLPSLRTTSSPISPLPGSANR